MQQKQIMKATFGCKAIKIVKIKLFHKIKMISTKKGEMLSSISKAQAEISAFRIDGKSCSYGEGFPIQ